MIAVYVEPVRTPYTLPEIAGAMRTALSAGRTELVRDDVLALALAKSALETGRWRSCRNHNLGNVKAGPTYAGMFTCFDGVSEIIDGRERWFSPAGELSGKAGQLIEPARAVPPGHPQTRFRAYANRYDGAYSYVDALVANFPRSYTELFTGDATRFVRTLKDERYFTASEHLYLAAVRSLHGEFQRALKGIVEPALDHDWDAIRATVAAQQFDLRAELWDEENTEPNA
jgi:hypothetical protein